MTYKAVFLDQDGALVPGVPRNLQSRVSELKDEVIEGLQRLQSYGYLLVVLSNDGDVDNESKVLLRDSCAQLGIYLDGFYSVGDEQPISGACNDLNIDLSSSWVVGDTLHDVEAGNKAGCKSIMINNGREPGWMSGSYHLPAFLARDLSEASRYIVAADNVKASGQNAAREKVYVYSSATPNQ